MVIIKLQYQKLTKCTYIFPGTSKVQLFPVMIHVKVNNHFDQVARTYAIKFLKRQTIEKLKKRLLKVKCDVTRSKIIISASFNKKSFLQNHLKEK